MKSTEHFFQTVVYVQNWTIIFACAGVLLKDYVEQKLAGLAQHRLDIAREIAKSEVAPILAQSLAAQEYEKNRAHTFLKLLQSVENKICGMKDDRKRAIFEQNEILGELRVIKQTNQRLVEENSALKTQVEQFASVEEMSSAENYE